MGGTTMKAATRTSDGVERRRAGRRRIDTPALIGGRDMPKERFENGELVEKARGGIRIRSGRPLSVNDTIFVYVDDPSKPVRAKVVWSKADGLIEKRGSGRLGNACAAGCRVMPGEKKAEAKRGVPNAAAAHAVSLAIKLALWGGLMAGVGFFVYLMFALFSMVK